MSITENVFSREADKLPSRFARAGRLSDRSRRVAVVFVPFRHVHVFHFELLDSGISEARKYRVVPVPAMGGLAGNPLGNLLEHGFQVDAIRNGERPVVSALVIVILDDVDFHGWPLWNWLRPN